MSDGKFSEEAKLGFSIMFIVALVALGIAVMTGNGWVIAGALIITGPIFAGSIAAVRSNRWD